MTRLLASLLVLGVAAQAQAEVYELRVYWANEGKLDALHARFRDHTMKLFEKHGIKNIGYWVPVENKDNRLIYLLAHPSREAAAANFKAFAADPDWKKAASESEKNGRLVAKIQSVFLDATEFSAKPEAKDGKVERVFELRTYACTPNNLPSLLGRFKNHTTKLFEKHGITNIAYFTLNDDKVTWAKLLPATTAMGDDKAEIKAEDAAKPAALVYFLAHASDDARKKSFDAFRADPVWVAAKAESEKNAGGSLTVKDGVKSLVLKATDYSPLK